MFWYFQQSIKEEETFYAENVKILYYLQSLLARVSGLSVDSSQLSLFYPILIYRTTVFSKLYQFWDILQSKIAWDSPYIVNIGDMRLRVCELQENNKEVKTLRDFAGLQKD